MEGYKLRNCFRKVIPIVIDELYLYEDLRTDVNGSCLSKLFNIDAKYSVIFQKQADAKLRIRKIIHWWIVKNEGKPRLVDLLTLLETNGMSKAKENILGKIPIAHPKFLDTEEPGHIPRPEETKAASELFNDNQSLIVYGGLGVGKTYFVDRLLKIALQDTKEVIVRLDFNNFSNSLDENCSKFGIQMEERQPYDLVIDFLNADPDFVILDGLKFMHELGEKYFTLCRDYQKEFYFKMIAITVGEDGLADFDLVIQIKPFDNVQVSKFIPNLEPIEPELADYCRGNPGRLTMLSRFAKDGKLTEDGAKRFMIRNLTTKLREFGPIGESNPVLLGMVVAVINFVGRVEELSILHELYETGRRQVVLITGLGGVGKTELVKRFVSELVARHSLNYMWIKGKSEISIRRSLIQIANQLGLTGLADGDKSTMQIFEHITNVIMKNSSKNWLIVIDNMDENQDIVPQMLQILRNRTSQNFTKSRTFTIVTSRKLTIDGFSPFQLRLGVLNPEESVNFFREEFKLEADEDIQNLCNLLQHLPLAMQQAAAYIKLERTKSLDGKCFRIANYVNLFNKQTELSLGFDTKRYGNFYQSTVLRTWDVTIEKIRENQNFGEIASQLLNIMAFLDPDNTMQDFIQSKHEYIFGHFGATTIDNAFCLIKNYSMIAVDQRVCRIHRLCQQVIRLHLLSTDTDYDLAKKLLQSLNVMQMDSQNITQALHAWRYASQNDTFVRCMFSTPNLISMRLRELSKTDVCLQFSTESHLRLCQVLGSNHEASLTMEKNVGVATMDSGFHENALKTFNNLLTKMHLLLQENDEEILQTQNYKGMALLRLQRYEEGLFLLNTVLSIRQSTTPSENFWTAVTKNDIACALSGLQRTKEAILLHEEVLEWRMQNTPNNWLTMLSRFNIAACAYQLQKLDYAKTQLRLIISEGSFLGYDHSLYLNAKHFYARILYILKEYKTALTEKLELFTLTKTMHPGRNLDTFIAGIDAITLMLKLQRIDQANFFLQKVAGLEIVSQTQAESASAIATNSLLAPTYSSIEERENELLALNILCLLQTALVNDEDHAIFLTELKISNCMFSLSKYEEVRTTLVKLIRAYEGKIGANHNLIIAAKSTLGMTYCRLNNFASGLSLLKEVHQIRLAQPNANKVSLLSAAHNIAWCYAEQGKDFEAKMVFEKLLRIESTELEERHNLTLTTMSVLGSVLCRLEEFDTSIEMLRKVYKLRRGTIGTMHPTTVHAFHEYANVLLLHEDFPKAKNKFERILHMKVKIFGESHQSTMLTKALLGMALHKMGEFENGMLILRDIFAVQSNKLPVDQRDVLHTQHFIARCLLHEEKFEEAKTLFEQVVMGRTKVFGANNLLTTLTRHWLGVTYAKLDNFGKASEVLQSVLQTREETRGKMHPATILTRNAIQEIQSKSGKCLIS